MKMPRVLCIEGDAPTRALLRRLLEAEGFSVDESATGLAGLQRALTLTPDLVLADAHLPDIEGFELAARIKQEGALRRVPFVALGEAAKEHDVSLAAGADGFIARPIDQARFAQQVRSYLEGKRETLPAEEERAGLRALSATLAAHLESAVAGASVASARLAESDRLRSAFMHNVAHELSTPLTPLAGYLKILQSDKLGVLSPQQRKVVEAMSLAANKLTRIIDNLSDFASLQAGEAPILAAPVDPDQIVDDAVEELRPAIRDARLHVEVKPSRGGPIEADPRKLRQAISNVIGNAVKFSPHGGEVLVEVLRDAERLRVAVYDQGPGIAAGDAVGVFEPFFHAARARGEDARQPGSGLGLPVAKRIVEAHGGTVLVESPPHSQPVVGSHHYTGCKIVIELPVRSAHVQTARARVSG
jgi:signal transduction histidine kinase